VTEQPSLTFHDEGALAGAGAGAGAGEPGEQSSGTGGTPTEVDNNGSGKIGGNNQSETETLSSVFETMFCAMECLMLYVPCSPVEL